MVQVDGFVVDRKLLCSNLVCYFNCNKLLFCCPLLFYLSFCLILFPLIRNTTILFLMIALLCFVVNIGSECARSSATCPAWMTGRCSVGGVGLAKKYTSGSCWIVCLLAPISSPRCCVGASTWLSDQPTCGGSSSSNSSSSKNNSPTAARLVSGSVQQKQTTTAKYCIIEPNKRCLKDILMLYLPER